MLIHAREIIADIKALADNLAEYFSMSSRVEHLSVKFLSKKIINEQVLIYFNIDIHYSCNDAFDMRELTLPFLNCRPTAEGSNDIHNEILKHLS